MKSFKRHHQADGRIVVNVRAHYSMATRHFVKSFALIRIPPPRKAAGYAEHRNTLLVLFIVTVVCTVATKALSTWQRSMPCPEAVGEPPIRHTGSAINEVAKALQRNARVV